MKKHINYLLASVIVAFGGMMTSCDDDDNNMSRAVLVSTDVLEYPSDLAAPQEVVVTSDADWVAEYPEWITVTPSAGSAGQTTVEIAVRDNFKDNATGSPRSEYVIFKGRDLRSNYKLLVKQEGDKFRDLDITPIANVADVDDGVTLYVTDLTVAAVTKDGFVATDGSDNLYFAKPENPVSIGMKVSVMGDKKSENSGFPYMLAEKVTAGETVAAPTQTATDIKDVIGQAKSPTFVSYVGVLDGKQMKITDTKYTILVNDGPADIDMDEISGHLVAIEGYYMGVSSNEVLLVASKMEDRGIAEVVLFEDDFQWLEPWWTVGDGTGSPSDDPIALYSYNTNCTFQMQKCIVDGVSAYDAMLAKGYDFVYAGHPVAATEGSSAKDCTYLLAGYIKLCKTSYHAGLVLPSISGATAGKDVTLTFNWTPMMTSSNNFDGTTLQVIVENDGVEKRFDVPSHGLVNKKEWYWVKAEIVLKDAIVNENTKITIRQTDDQFPDSPNKDKGTTKRFFLDNIKVSQPVM